MQVIFFHCSRSIFSGRNGTGKLATIETEIEEVQIISTALSKFV